MLAARLLELDLPDPVVVALPRGGVPVGFEVAEALRAPLDIGLVRKLGHPNQPELGLGAIGEDGTVVLDERAMGAFGITRAQIDPIAAREAEELDRRRRIYRGERPPVEVRGRTVVVVDDGIATGVTAAAASGVLKAQGAARVILAVPVCPAGTAERIDGDIDEVVSLAAPQHFSSVGAWYEDFSQTSDEEVIDLLEAARGDDGGTEDPVPEPSGEVTIPTADGAALGGALRIPAGRDGPRGLRPRQRLEPAQPAQQLGRPLPRGPRLRDAPLRSAHARPRPRTGATSSTSTCSPGACSTPPPGPAAAPASPGCRSPCSEPPPARRPR